MRDSFAGEDRRWTVEVAYGREGNLALRAPGRSAGHSKACLPSDRNAEAWREDLLRVLRVTVRRLVGFRDGDEGLTEHRVIKRGDAARAKA
jgi:hypothetical protein